jgi:probable HAF family extracellular repeat protein
VRAFHWTETGGMVSLGVLDGAATSHARAVNADGSVVVGWSGSQAMRWVEDEGMTAIPFLTGGTWSYALDVSADGQIVVGASDSDTGVRAFAWNSETVQSVPIDLENTAQVVQRAASDIGAAVASRNRGAMGGLVRELDLTGPGGSVTRGASLSPVQSSSGPARPLTMAVSVGAGLLHPAQGGQGSRTDVMAVLGIGDRLSLGGFLDIRNGPSQQGLLDFDGRETSGGIWLRHRSADFRGLTWRLAAMSGNSDVRVTRDDVLPDTEAGSGATSLDTRAASIELGWGLPVQRGVVIPFLRLSHARTERGAYDEEDSIGFPLSFGRHVETLTSLTLAVEGRFAVGPRGTLHLTAGAARDLSRSRSPVTGTSSIPGFEDFSIDMPEVANTTRAFASLGYSHALTPQSAINLSASASRNPWSAGYDAELRLGLEARF